VNVEALAAAVTAGVVSALVTNLAAPLARTLAVAARALDHPGGRKQHQAPVPRMGGLAIVIGLAAGTGTAALGFWGNSVEGLGARPVASLALGAAIVFLVGLAEDIVGVSALKRLLAECAAAWVIVGAGGWSFSYFGLPLLGDVHLGVAGPVVSMLWIVVVTNAVNLLDGLDGLATGVVGIIAGSMVVYSVMEASLLSAVVLAGVAGACAGFLRHNWEPARIFMGDAGSLTLGFVLASASVVSAQKATAAVAILIPILALGVPVIDTLLVVLVRLLESPRAGARERVQRVFRADRLHLHHLLETFARRRSAIVRWVYLMVVISCTMALVVAVTKNGRLGWLLVVVELTAIALIRQLGWARMVSRPRLVGLEGDGQSPPSGDRASAG